VKPRTRETKSSSATTPHTGNSAANGIDFSGEADAVLERILATTECLIEDTGKETLQNLLREIHTYRSLMEFSGAAPQADLAAKLEKYLYNTLHGDWKYTESTATLIQRAVAALADIHSYSEPERAEQRIEALHQHIISTLADPPQQYRTDKSKSRNPRPTEANSATMTTLPHAGSFQISPEELAKLETMASNLSRMAQLLEELNSDTTNERLQVLTAAVRQNAERLHQCLHQKRFTNLHALFLPMIPILQRMAAGAGIELSVRLPKENLTVDVSRLGPLLPAILHILRNSIAHGIEPPSEREAAGKSPTGTITISAVNTKGELHLTIQDDGCGFDPEGLRQAAVGAGAMSVQEANSMPDAEALKLALLPGVSTHRQLDDLGGLGMGLAAVTKDLERLGGRLEIESHPGKGTALTLVIPAATA